MRIGIIAHLKHPIAEPFAGGLETHTSMLAGALRRRGHEVTVFASDESDPSLGAIAICPRQSLHDVGTDEIRDTVFFREHHAYLSLMTALRESRFDIIHNNSLHYLPVSMAATLPMPMLTTLHTPPFGWLESGIRLGVPPRARYVAISEATARLWQPITPVDRIILNGIDLERFEFREHADPQAYAVWSGRLVREKGLHVAIAAARLLDLPLQIAGPLSDVPYFEHEIRPLLGPAVSYVGHLDQRSLSRLVGGATVSLCSPLWPEPYGLVVAEALSCGTPVASFDRGAVGEIIDGRSGVLASSFDARSLADAAARAQTLNRIDCRLRAKAVCDMHVMVDAYEQYYVDVVRSHRQQRPVERSDEIKVSFGSDLVGRLRQVGSGDGTATRSIRPSACATGPTIWTGLQGEAG